MPAPIKFTVIVPTRERADTLVHCLRTLVAQEYPDLEIIVSDNFSQDGTRAVAASFSDPRIRYVNTGKRVSMSHNWEFALGHVKEGWVMFLGDDDGLYPWALQTLNDLIEEYKVEALWSACGEFIWPGHHDACPRGDLVVPLTDSVRLSRSKDALERIFSGKSAELPWLYAGGAASIELINRSRDANGRFFCSCNPDWYSAVALSSATDRFLAVSIPIAISGASKHSNGTANLNAAAPGEAAKLFMSESNIPFHETLVQGKSPQVAWYESYLQSWHIHQGSLGVKLSEQLEIALSIAAPGQLKEIVAQCRAIAEKNGLPEIRKRGGGRSPFKALAARGKRIFNRISIDPKQLGVVNIYDAIMASAYIYKFLSNGLFGGKLDLFLINTRRVFLKLKGRAFRGQPRVK